MRFFQSLRDIGRSYTYYPRLAEVVGGVGPALFLSALNSWDGQGVTDGDWIYKTKENLTDETGLTRREQDAARKKLRELDILEENYRRLDHRMFYRINEDVLEAFWDAAFPKGVIVRSGKADAYVPDDTKTPFVSLANKTSSKTTDKTTWPEWFSLGHELKGWVIDIEVAVKWALEHRYSDAYCLGQIYKVRSWWTKDHERKGRNPYSTFQSACRDDWAKQDGVQGRGAQRQPVKPGAFEGYSN